MIDKSMLEKYKIHPRILEIKFALLFDLFEREYGYVSVLNIYEGLCIAFKRNKPIIDTLIARRFDIKRNAKKDRLRWKQEALFMGMCYGITPSRICKDYLGIASSNVYQDKTKNDPNSFIDEAWLDKLDEEVDICGSSAYRTEIKGFFEVIDGLTTVLCKWKGDKNARY